MYKSKSRSCLECVSVFCYHKDKNNAIQTLQNRFTQPAYPCRNSTPINTLEIIANIPPIHARVQKLTLRHYYRARYSSPHHPLYKTLSYHNHMNNNKNNNLFFSIAYNMLHNDKTGISLSHNMQPTNCPISALPKYEIFEIPTNYHISIKPMQPNNINLSENDFYTDDSCVPNPGRGAYGWFTPNFEGTERKQISHYKYPTTITSCELMAILDTSSNIKTTHPSSSKINIFTDCQAALQYLSFKAFPKYNNIKLIVQAIFKLFTMIQKVQPKLKIHMHKVKSHSNITGNNIIDNLVRNTANQVKYDNDQFKHIPYPVTLA